LNNVQCQANSLCELTPQSGGPHHLVFYSRGGSATIAYKLGSAAVYDQCGAIMTTMPTTLPTTTTPAPTPVTTTTPSPTPVTITTTPGPTPSTTTTTKATSATTRTIDVGTTPVSSQTTLSTHAATTTTTQSSQCAQCNTGFGVPGTLQWCQCCQNDCGGLKSGCIDQGYCSTRCNTFPGFSCGNDATSIATTTTSASGATPSSSTIDCFPAEEFCECIEGECLEPFECVAEVCVRTTTTTTGSVSDTTESVDSAASSFSSLLICVFACVFTQTLLF